jgi:hypothetical protein
MRAPRQDPDQHGPACRSCYPRFASQLEIYIWGLRTAGLKASTSWGITVKTFAYSLSILILLSWMNQRILRLRRDRAVEPQRNVQGGHELPARAISVDLRNTNATNPILVHIAKVGN